MCKQELVKQCEGIDAGDANAYLHIPLRYCRDIHHYMRPVFRQVTSILPLAW